MFTAMMLASLAAMPLIPGAWLASLPIAGFLSAAMALRKTRLPYRLPLSWKGRDYGSPVPGGGRKFRSGEGLLFLGNEFGTEEEVWISNSDARRHALVLATTGAGKALPDETLILTPGGWRSNGDLRAGERVIHPSGRKSKILSVHPQGKLPVVRLTFADGRRRNVRGIICGGSGCGRPLQPVTAPQSLDYGRRPILALRCGSASSPVMQGCAFL